jgi:hypothetical protein
MHYYQHTGTMVIPSKDMRHNLSTYVQSPGLIIRFITIFEDLSSDSSLSCFRLLWYAYFVM